MIISEDNTLPVRLEELNTFLLKQAYPPVLIDDSTLKIKALNRSDLLKPNESVIIITRITIKFHVSQHNPEIYPKSRQTNLSS